MSHESAAAACTGKRGITSRQIADVARQRGTGSRTSYRCASCGLWHLGTTVRRAAAATDKTLRLRDVRAREAIESEA